MRVNACLALGSIDVGAADVNKAVDELARRVTDDREGIVRFHAAMALVTFGKEAKAAIPKLITASRDGSSWEIRKAAVMALGKVGVAEKDDPLDMRAANNLISVLNTEATAQVRLEAAIALGSMGKPARTEDLVLMEAALKRATGDRDLTVRIWAAVGFMAITEKVPEEYLVIVAKIMKAPELVHRCHAARALGTIGEKAKSRVPDLIELLADKQREAQASSVWALGRIGDARALPALQELSQRKDIDEEMKQYLKGVIENLSKKK